MDTNKNFNPLQHGFRKRLFCDSQLLSLFHDLAGGPFFLTDRAQKVVLDGADRVSNGTCYVGSTSGFGSGPYPFPNLYK